MKRSYNVFFVLAALLLVASTGLRFINGANMRWAPLLMICGFCFLASALALYRRNQQQNESGRR